MLNSVAAHPGGSYFFRVIAGNEATWQSPTNYRVIARSEAKLGEFGRMLFFLPPPLSGHPPRKRGGQETDSHGPSGASE